MTVFEISSVVVLVLSAIGLFGLIQIYGKSLKKKIKESEIVVSETTSELQTLVQALNEHSIVAKTDIKGKIIYANDMFCQVSGYSRDELLGRDHRILNSGYHSSDFFKSMWDTLKTGKKWRGQLRNKSKHDQYYWVDTTITPIKNSDGKIIEYLSIRTEITEQKNLEKEILDSKEYLDFALEGAGLGIWDWDLTTNEVLFDDRWAEMLGLKVSEIEMALSTWESRVHPGDITNCYKDIKDYMDMKTDRYENVHRMKHADGHWVYILDRGKISKWAEDGRPLRFTGTHLDITQTKRDHEEKLLQLNEILSSTPSCLKVIDKDGFLIAMNQQGLELIETDSLDSVFKANVYEIVEESHRQNFIEFNERVCAGSKESLIFEIIGLKGSRRWLESYAAPYKLANGEIGHIAITNDITDRINSEEEYKRQKAFAQHHAKLASIGELAAGVGHEINNPLAILKGYISTIGKKVEKKESVDSSDLVEYLDKVNIAINRISKIVQGLRTFSRSDSAESDYFDPVDAVQESFDMIKEIYRNDGVDITLDIPVGLSSISLFGSRGKFQQVLMNLISNAKDAIKGNEEMKISISYRVVGRDCEICIVDNGMGISKENQDKIFDPFFTTKDVDQGVGIGLSLVHNFVNELGGIIRVESEEDKGTSFILKLPIPEKELEHTNSNKSASVEQEKTKRFINCCTILADDEDDIRELLSIFLEEMGMEVTSVENGKVAYDEILSNPGKYDLVISDMKMPEMDGPSLLKSIRGSKEISHQPKFVFITGGININFEGTENELNKMIDGYFFKPFDEGEIFKVLSKVMAQD